MWHPGERPRSTRSRTWTSRRSCAGTASAIAPGTELERRLDIVGVRVEAACGRVGRVGSDVTILPVSKGVPIAQLRAGLQDGTLGCLAENRVQEAAQKIAGLRDVPLRDGRPVEWHLVGHLQANKARRALELFSVIQTIDSVRSASRVDALAGERGAPARIYLQVNVDGDPAKAGFDPSGIERGLDHMAALSHLMTEGLMTVGRQVDSPGSARPTFVALRSLSERLRVRWAQLGPGLSMGMSDDFEIAIEEGSTIVRVGRAIFGERLVH